MGFPQDLKRFSEVVDIVDDEALKQAWDSVWDYAQSEFSAHLIELLEPVVVGIDMKNGLTEKLHKSHGAYAGWTNRELLDGDRKHVGYVSFAFAEKKPIWAIFNDEGSVTQHWCKNVPDVRVDVVDEITTRTEITIPLLVASSAPPVGVFNIESSRALPPKSAHQFSDIESVGEALARLLQLHTTFRLQKDGTSSGLDWLKGRSVDIQKEKAFIAYAGNSDARVIDAIRAALLIAGFGEETGIYDWNRDVRPGDIRKTLWKEVRAAKLFVCYISGEVESEPRQYQDNPNVLMELGMGIAMHEEYPSVVGEPIIVREKKTIAPMAFDYSGFRVIEPPRDAEGNLDRERWSLLLEKTLRPA